MAMTPTTVFRYFRGDETTRPQELIYGVVREPPAPFPYHQGVVTHLTSAMHVHVREHELGSVYVSPIDVVLDEARALVLQPDIIFIAATRREIVRDRVWGAPDLVVEVLSSATARRDRTEKLGWYRQYGVRECWLVDPTDECVDVVNCTMPDEGARFAGAQVIRSRVLPSFTPRAQDLFV